MAKKRLSRDQERKSKRTERAPSRQAEPSLVSTGCKFLGAELVPGTLAVEPGIAEADAIARNPRTDRHAHEALLVRKLGVRVSMRPADDYDEDEEEDEEGVDDPELPLMERGKEEIETGYDVPGTTPSESTDGNRPRYRCGSRERHFRDESLVGSGSSGV